jgi:FixJ family two-component response regulator
LDRFDTTTGNHCDHRTARPSADGIHRLLILSRDSRTIEAFAQALDRRADIQVTCLSSEEGCSFPAEVEAACALILDAESAPLLSSGLKAAKVAGRPVLCLAREQDLAGAVRLMPSLPFPILLKPLQAELVLEHVDATLRREAQARMLAGKYGRMRRLVRRVVRERRDINRRVELVCRDLVEAHRRLTHRVVELHQTRSGPD